jgi:paraquat-inducible protein B
MEIAAKIEKIPLEQLAGDAGKTIRTLDSTLKSAEKLLKNVDGSVIPEVHSVLLETRQSLEEVRRTLGGANQLLAGDAPVHLDLRETLREVSRAAQSMRLLGDYLQQHPESLIRGKREEK